MDFPTPTFPLPSITHTHICGCGVVSSKALIIIRRHFLQQRTNPPPTHTHKMHTPSLPHTLPPVPPLTTPDSFPVADTCIRTHTHTSPSADPCLLLWPSLFLGIKGTERNETGVGGGGYGAWGWERERGKDGGCPDTFLCPIKFPPSQWNHLWLSYPNTLVSRCPCPLIQLYGRKWVTAHFSVVEKHAGLWQVLPKKCREKW